jgi:hypothetical protein
MNHGQTWTHKTHKTHHGPDLGEATTFPLIVFFVPSHYPNVILSQDSQIETPGMGTPTTFEAHNFFLDLQFRCGMKQSCSPCWELSNDMQHATCTKVNQGDSWLLVVRSQIGNLIPSPYGHNICFKYPNGPCEPMLNIYVSRASQCGSCKPILDIYVSRTFQCGSCDPILNIYISRAFQCGSCEPILDIYILKAFQCGSCEPILYIYVSRAFQCGSWEPILDIYVSRDFQWYKKLFNLMGFKL